MEPTKLHAYCIDKIDNLHIYGRTGRDESGGNSALALFWTGSGISVDFTAGELWAELEGGYSEYECWVSVWINGAPLSRFILQKGRRWYCLVRGLNQNVSHHIAILKETQAMSGDPEHLFLVHRLGVPSTQDNGRVFVPQKKKDLKIEFVGDSITTGEGLAGCVLEMDWISGWMSLRDNYAVLTSLALNADFRILSQSGWGVVTGWDNDRNSSLPKHYSKICGLAPGKKNEDIGAQDENDFSKWQPDFIVVNLGTNDWGAFNNPAKTDPETGGEWKMHLDENGEPSVQDLSFFKTGISNFIADLRAKNPRAEIIWAYGMCSFDLGEHIKSVVDFMGEKDLSLHFIKLPSMAEEKEGEFGSRQHPGPGTHRRAASLIVEEIKRIAAEKGA
ncbi:MAG: hypothetical protein J5930_01645 [Treponema sp.]|nr:hypothetical protein [Treponema sp.]